MKFPTVGISLGVGLLVAECVAWIRGVLDSFGGGGIWLALLTAAEVAVVGFTALPKSWIVVALLIMAVWKALLVALYFMHLRFEPLRLAVLAASPLPLAVLLVMTVLQEYR